MVGVTSTIAPVTMRPAIMGTSPFEQEYQQREGDVDSGAR